MKDSMRIWFLLAIATFGAICMVFYRVVESGGMQYSFMLWNLFLAWLPALWAWISRSFAEKLGRGNLLSMIFLLCWLLFLPNAPYLFTDLIHFDQVSHPLTIWYDLVMLLNFAMIGLFISYLTISSMQEMIRGWFGKAVSWLFFVIVMLLNSLGVYMGRELRWNSWDALTRPKALMAHVLEMLPSPFALKFVFLMAVFLSFVHLSLEAIRRLPSKK